MHKIKANALWNELSPEQLETLDKWLFEKKLSFAEAWPKAQSELGFKGSISSLQRYYHRRKQEKKVEEIAELTGDVAEVGGRGSGARGEHETAELLFVTGVERGAGEAE